MIFSENNASAIGVDLGGTKVEVAEVDQQGRVLQRLRFSTNAARGPQAIEDEIVGAVTELRKKSKSAIEGIGVGVAGQINPRDGAVTFAPNLHWHCVPLQSDLTRNLDLPVAVLNDVRAATWGEWIFGAGKGCRDLVCLFIGTGIGGGVVSGGRLLTGCSNTAGELGHMTLALGGRLCHCGNSGCFEAYAGGWAIADIAREAVASHRREGDGLLRAADGDVNAIDAKIVIEASREGDSLASAIMDEVAQALGAGCVGLVNAFNPCKLILGGGIIEGDGKLVEQARLFVSKRALQSAAESLQVAPSHLHNDAGVVGAAAFVFSSRRKETQQWMNIE
jgi:glucokinase